MPQFTLEYSANIIEKNHFEQLFQRCHVLLGDELPTDINTCKSRAIECGIYLVGTGKPKSAFVHATLQVMPGRSKDTLKSVGERLMIELGNYFAESLKKLDLQVTLEIVELEEYFKITS